MGIKALSGLVPEWYTPAGQEDDPTPTRFRLRPLNGSEYGEVADYIDMVGGRIFIRNAGRDLCLKTALLDWENFEGFDGPLEFSMNAIDLIPHTLRVELVNRILEISTLGEEQVKNS